jgi:NADPH-dependent 2,4-dienoyl-CoA reductase/sulfur reductase-like enzyme
MEQADVVIVGGSAAGATAAISCKRRNPGKSVTVVRQEEQVSVPCGIPYIFGTLGSPQKNIIPDASLTGSGVQLVVSPAEAIDPKKKAVRTARGDIGYDRLILATGSLPVLLPIPGIDKKNVFIVKKDVAYLQQMLDAVNGAADIVVIGGGFIGAEFADECKKNRKANLPSSRSCPTAQLAFDDEFCVEAEDVLKERGVKIIGNDTVASILGDGKVRAVRLSSGAEIKADVVIASIGVSPNTELARKAGLRIDDITGGVVVDRYQRVENSADILACGDCSMKVSFFSGRPIKTWLASIATNEARLAAATFSPRSTPDWAPSGSSPRRSASMPSPPPVSPRGRRRPKATTSSSDRRRRRASTRAGCRARCRPR